MHTALRLGVEVAKRIREANATARIAFLGLYAHLNANYLLKEKLADYVMAGEYEISLLECIQSVEAGKEFQPSSLRIQRMEYPILTFDSLPPLSKYAKLEMGDVEKNVGTVETTRGCKHVCSHCPITPVYAGHFFAIPKENVLSQIDDLVEKGVEHISFSDADFLNGPTHAEHIVKEAHQRHPHLTFDFTTKVEHMVKHQKQFSDFSKCGTLFVVSAFESLNDTVLHHLKKGHTKEDIVHALSIAREAGIFIRPSFVPFTPWETLESYLELLHFIFEQNLFFCVDPVQLTIRLLIPPQSPLAVDPAMKPYLKELQPENFSYDWKHPDPRMDELQQKLSFLAVQNGTFAELLEVSFSVKGCEIPKTIQIENLVVQNKSIPRMTETWFCCAEPREYVQQISKNNFEWALRSEDLTCRGEEPRAKGSLR